MSVLRAVMTPSKGAVIFWKACRSSRRFTLAPFESTMALRAL